MCVHNTASLLCSNFHWLSMMSIVAGGVPKPHVWVSYQSCATSLSNVCRQSTHLTGQGNVKWFIPVIDYLGHTPWSISSWEFLVTFVIIYHYWIASCSRRWNWRRFQRLFRFWIGKGWRWQDWGDQRSELLFIMLTCLRILLKVLLESFAWFFLNQLVENNHCSHFLYSYFSLHSSDHQV